MKPKVLFNFHDLLEFEVNHEIKLILDNLRGPIGVIAVAG